MFGIVRRTLLNDRRAHGRRTALAVRVAGDAEIGERYAGDLEAAELRVDLARAWRTLTYAQQEVLSLTFFEQLDAEHAASVLGVRVNAYRVRLTRARAALRAALDDPRMRAAHAPASAAVSLARKEA